MTGPCVEQAPQEVPIIRKITGHTLLWVCTAIDLLPGWDAEDKQVHTRWGWGCILGLSNKGFDMLMK